MDSKGTEPEFILKALNQQAVDPKAANQQAS